MLFVFFVVKYQRVCRVGQAYIWTTRRNMKVRFPRVVFIILLVGLLLGQMSTSMASTEDEQNNIEIYKAAAPGVVNITTVSVLAMLVLI